MKQFLLAFLLMISVAVSAQNEKFTGAMQSKLAAYSSAKTPEDFLDLSNAFERIAEAEKNQWLAYYYAAHAQVIYGYLLSQKDASGLDPIADKAEQLINKADALEQNNSEISCIKSMIASLRMFVNPMQRYMQYGTLHHNTWKQQSNRILPIHVHTLCNRKIYFIHRHSLEADAQQQNQWQSRV
jgi:hypothetical protein